MTVSALDMAKEERTELASFLAGLDSEDWQRESLCVGWTVQDVVAHMISYDDLSRSGLVGRFLAGRLVHANQIGVDLARGQSSDEVLQRLRAHLRPQGLTAGFGGMIGLTDGMIHHQDIRRALDRPRQIPPNRLLRVIASVPGNPRLAARRWIKGLRLVATDLDWSHGAGPEVAGTAEALLMAMAGRPSVLAELTGAGVATMESRFG